MRLIDADKLPYEDIESVDGNTYMCVNAYDIEHAPTIEQSEDCVKRIDAINGIANTHFAISYENYKELINVISNLPPVVPQTKRGEWEDCSNGWMCSECSSSFIHEYNFCPKCGADMREAREDDR